MNVASAVFRFPSDGKVSPKYPTKIHSPHFFGVLFRFPCSGKVSPKLDTITGELAVLFEFRFPCSGKVSPKEYNESFSQHRNWFRFPSTGKVSPKKLKVLLITLFFSTKGEFPFPLTGKVSPKVLSGVSRRKI